MIQQLLYAPRLFLQLTKRSFQLLVTMLSSKGSEKPESALHEPDPGFKGYSFAYSWLMRFYLCFGVICELLGLVVYSVQVYLINIIVYLFPSNVKSLKHDVILVTGGGSGAGREVCLYLAEVEPEATLVIWDDDKGDLERFRDELIAIDFNKYHMYRVDVGNVEQVEKTAKLVKQKAGTVTMVIHLSDLEGEAGVGWKGKLEDIEKVYRVNFLSFSTLLKEFMPGMIDRGYGHVAAIVPISGIKKGRLYSFYAASKSALETYIESVKEEVRLVPTQPDIKFSTVYPKFSNELSTGPLDYYSFFLDHMTPRSIAEKTVDGIRRNLEYIHSPQVSRLERLITLLLATPVTRRIADLVDLLE